MLEEAYCYGLTPQQATELTVAEMASFISAKKKHEMKQYEILAQIGYSAGIVASMSLAKKRPKFEELFTFPKEVDKQRGTELLKSQMLIWAENTNRRARKATKKENK